VSLNAGIELVFSKVSDCRPQTCLCTRKCGSSSGFSTYLHIVMVVWKHLYLSMTLSKVR